MVVTSFVAFISIFQHILYNHFNYLTFFIYLYLLMKFYRSLMALILHLILSVFPFLLHSCFYPERLWH